MSKIYHQSTLWLTIDIEQLADANFGVTIVQDPQIDYEKIIDEWIEMCAQLNIKTTCFVLGSFAKKYPQSIQKLAQNGHEIASHGLTHELVYNQSFEEFQHSITESKRILEEITHQKVTGYRSASWSLPFDKKYYNALAKAGYSYSSSYFPFKTYMYGNSIDRKAPFTISTPSGEITEFPLLKSYLPFSGGFYLRVFPLWLITFFIKILLRQGNKPIIYTHPYEISGKYLLWRMKDKIKINLAYLLAFAETTPTQKKLQKLLMQL